MKGNDVVAEVVSINGIPEPTEIIGVSGHLEWLVVDDLQIDPRYQRDLSELQVRKITKNFDPDAFGVITISSRVPGGLFVVDGQHRIAALRQMGWGQQRVPCIVYRNLSLEDEAKVFYLPQTTRKYMTPGQRFRARLVANEPTAIELKRLVEFHGFSLNLTNGGSADAKELDAIAALEFIDRQYSIEHLGLVLKVMHEAWSDNEAKLQGNMIRGLAMFLYRFGKLYNRARLIRVLRDVSPVRIDSNGREIMKVLGGSRDDAFGRSIHRVYNHKLQTNRLPEWEASGRGKS